MMHRQYEERNQQAKLMEGRMVAVMALMKRADKELMSKEDAILAMRGELEIRGHTLCQPCHCRLQRLNLSLPSHRRYSSRHRGGCAAKSSCKSPANAGQRRFQIGRRGRWLSDHHCTSGGRDINGEHDGPTFITEACRERSGHRRAEPSREVSQNPNPNPNLNFRPRSLCESLNNPVIRNLVTLTCSLILTLVGGFSN